MFARRAFPITQQTYKAFTTTNSLTATRTFSTTQLPNGIKLAYDLHEPPKDSTTHNAPAIVFLHGLFGSKQNNRSMSKYAPAPINTYLAKRAHAHTSCRVFARELKRPVYALDLRNHGDSSHDPRHDYTALAEDVELFMQQHRLEESTLIGHSMGAKTAMTIALRNKVPIASLLPVDNAPVDAALKSDFGKYVQGMKRIEDAQLKSKVEADKILQEYEDALPIRQFLLTNLVKDSASGILRFRFPVRWLAKNLDEMADFPFKDPDVAQYKGPTLMVRGTKSHYVADEMLPIIGRFFPKFEVRDVEAGHWVISEKPEEFRKVVIDFLQDSE